MDREPKGPKVTVPDRVTIELANDADVNRVWENWGNTSSPRERISVGEAILGGTSRPVDPVEDRLPQSDN